MQKIPSKSVAKSAVRLSTKNAWAQYARRRWPANGVKLAVIEWDLTEGEAKGLIFAQASQTTIDKILDHPRGGFRLGLKILEIRLSTRLQDFINDEITRLENDALTALGNAEAADRMAVDIAIVAGVGPVLRRRDDVRVAG